jgi:hypothetical protein
MTSNTEHSISALQKPVRNRYFYGKHLDVHHFELEQRYFNSKRWLLNRLVSGFGVVCGLNVVRSEEHNQDTVIVKPGLAIDKWGREIIVVKDSRPIKVAPPAPGSTGKGEEQYVYLCIEYLECEADPVPVLASECGTGQTCMPDEIHERYKITIHPGRAPVIGRRCHIPDLTNDDTGEIDYDVMAKWVSERCPARSEDPCIPLAQIEFDNDGSCETIDITVRPIVYTNDLLYEMILAMTEPDTNVSPGGKGY